MLHTNNTPRGNAGIWPAAVCITDCWFCWMTDCACTLPELCDAGRICTRFAAPAADSLELGPVELLPLEGPPRGPPPELLFVCGWSWCPGWSPIEEGAVPFSSTMLSMVAASCLSCHSPRPELPASFEILPAVSSGTARFKRGTGVGGTSPSPVVGVQLAIGRVSLTYTAPSHTTIFTIKKKNYFSHCVIIAEVSTHVNNFYQHNRSRCWSHTLRPTHHSSTCTRLAPEQDG